MRKLNLKAVFVIVLFSFVMGLSAEPVWKYIMTKDGISVLAEIPAGEYLYRKSTEVRAVSGEKEVVPSELPAAEQYNDSFSGQTEIYSGPAVFRWTFRNVHYPVQIQIHWQGCSKGSDGKPPVCFLPGSKEAYFKEFKSAVQPELFPENVSAAEENAVFPSFEIVRSETGYLAAPEFLQFLKREKQELFLSFSGKSFLVILLFVFLGGIALNLTPCVLPMIPVNLAMIGARTGSRGSCVLRGLVYGSGIALSYGMLGIAAVMTGSSFGIIDSTWWFNAFAAVLFILLGLSLFDVFVLDLSRYSSRFGNFSGAGYAGIFLMGAVSALLAGACVAPVVAATLLQAGKMYNAGEHAGLFLPFVLGAGMAFPWPLAAGGFSVMPEPGAWMKYVKYVFGVIIICLGAYYGWTAFEIGTSQSRSPESIVESRKILTEAIQESARTGQLVFIDFRAEWCKNCKAMEKNTFPDPAVSAELEKFIFVEFDATDISSPAVSSVLKKFDVSGLPTYLIVRGK